MRGLKKLMEKVSSSADVEWLYKAKYFLHDNADIAALNDDTREWNRLCDAESQVDKRIKEVSL